MVLLTCACTAASPAPPVATGVPTPPSLVTDAQNAPLFVRDVIDGRTVALDTGARVRISLLAPPAACWAAAAVAFAKKTLVSRPVRMTSVIPGEVNLWLEDGTDYALLAVREGVLRAQGAAGAIAEAEAVAAREDRGLWGLPCNGMDAAATTTTAAPPKNVQPPKPATTTPPPVVTTTPPPPPCTVSYRIGAQWPGGFQGGITIKNTGGAAINGWTLQWSFGDGQTVQHMLNATPLQRGATVKATNVFFTAEIAPGREVVVLFFGTARDKNTAPASFTLNGTTCATS